MPSPTSEWKISILAVTVLLATIFTFDPIQRGFAQPQAPTPPRATQEQERTVRLALAPAQVILAPKEQTTISVIVETEKERASAAEIRLSFDPKVANVASIKPADFWEDANVLLSEIDNQKGNVTFTVGTLSPKTGKGTLAKIVLRATAVGVATVNLTEESKVAALGKTGNVLAGTTDAVIRVK